MDLIRVFHMVCLVFSISLAGYLEVSANGSLQQNVPCKQGWFLYEEKCYKIIAVNNGQTWTESKSYCWAMERGHLASIHSNQLQEFLTAFLLLNSETNVWIGLHDRASEKNFKWDDGSIYDYTNWDKYEPSRRNQFLREEDCVEMRFKDYNDTLGTWNAESCYSLRPYLCQVSKSEETFSPDPRFCSIEDGGGWKYLNSCYHVVTEEKSWKDAEKYCEEKFKGYHVTIRDERSEIFLNYILSNFSKDVWIGIKMRDQALQKWASGWHVVYNKWDHKQEHFLDGTCGLRSNQKLWTVAQCSQKLPFICEKLKYNVPVLKKPPSDDLKCSDSSKKWLDLEGEFCYLIESSKSLNWSEANYECGRKGGTLAAIHSEEESNILHPYILNAEKRLKRLLIGLRRNSMTKYVFEWADGSELNYTNWNEGEPNSGREECVELWTESMKWNDIPCNIAMGYICKARKVFSKRTEDTTSTSKDHVYSSGVPTKTVVGIVFCNLLVTLLVCFVLYHSHKFWKRHRKNALHEDIPFSAQTSLSYVSNEVLLKPQE